MFAEKSSYGKRSFLILKLISNINVATGSSNLFSEHLWDSRRLAQSYWVTSSHTSNRQQKWGQGTQTVASSETFSCLWPFWDASQLFFLLPLLDTPHGDWFHYFLTLSPSPPEQKHSRCLKPSSHGPKGFTWNLQRRYPTRWLISSGRDMWNFSTTQQQWNLPHLFRCHCLPDSTSMESFYSHQE